MQEHSFKLHIDLEVEYPNHDPRTRSDVFAATVKHWKEQGACCWVCGTKDNIEIHHKYIEWADSLAVDWDKVKQEHPAFDWSKFKETKDFIDSIYNTIPLCTLHHRGKAPFGIHFTPEPIWNIQKYARSDFVYTKEQNNNASKGHTTHKSNKA